MGGFYQYGGSGGGGGVTWPLEASIDGTAAAPAYTFASDTNTGLYLTAADQLSLAAGGVEVLRVTESAGAVEADFGASRIDVNRAGGFNDVTMYFNGDQDLGFYSDASGLRLQTGGSYVWEWNISTGIAKSSNADGGGMFAGTSSSTVPTLLPAAGNDPNTGVGHAGADQLSLIAGGVESARFQDPTSSPSMLIARGGGVNSTIGGGNIPDIACADDTDSGIKINNDTSMSVILGGTDRFYWSASQWGSRNDPGDPYHQNSDNSHTFYADGDTGYYRKAANNSAIKNGGVDAVEFTSTRVDFKLPVNFAGGGTGGALAGVEHGNESSYYSLETDPSWTWGNQGTSTATFGTGLLMDIPSSAGGNIRALWSGVTIPASGDWVWVVEVSPILMTGANNQVGLIGLYGGTTASPTNLITLAINNTPQMVSQIWTNYTTFSSTLGNPAVATAAYHTSSYLFLGWDDSAADWYYYWSLGSGGPTSGSTAAATKPTDLGIFMEDSSSTAPSGLFRSAKLVVVSDATDFTEVAKEVYGDWA